MNYPVWDAPIGYGILMGIIAVLHVFVSHFAIGGGLYLVVTERRARRTGDAETLGFLRRVSRFFVLLTLVFGALSGVGIWFIIGLLNPAATEVLIHQFVWAWAIEWTFFVVEVAAALIYYYSWEKLAAREHLIIGWIYFTAAWLSLFVINGIVTFMFTPGRWLQSGNFWDGFFNPTFWPSLLLRTGVCVMLAGLYGLLLAAGEKAGDFKAKTVRSTAAWGFAGLVVTALSMAWYWKAIPAVVTVKAAQAMPFPMASMRLSIGLAVAIAIGLGIAASIWARRLPTAAAAVLLLLGLGWFGAFETFRESIRKPYVLAGYVYGNGSLVSKVAETQKHGLLAGATYRSGNDGADLFLQACRNCHTWTGYKPLKPAFDGTDPGFITAVVRGTHLLRGNMPPFPGTPAEAEKLAAWLHARTDRRPLSDIHAGPGLGRAAFERRCGICHALGSPGDKSKSFAGLSAEDIGGLLDMSADLGEGMPAYTGDAKERAALITYLQELGRKVKP